MRLHRRCTPWASRDLRQSATRRHFQSACSRAITPAHASSSSSSESGAPSPSCRAASPLSCSSERMSTSNMAACGATIAHSSSSEPSCERRHRRARGPTPRECTVSERAARAPSGGHARAAVPRSRVRTA
eukprot:6401551-Prymnesium_polylepis.1